MKRAEAAGCGGIVVKTLFEDLVTRRSPTPRFRVMRGRRSAEDSFVLYSYEQASSFGPERYSAEIRRAEAELEVPVIASIGCFSRESWVDYARLVEEAGAAGVELNLSCPHGRPMLTDVDVSESMCEVTQLVRERVSIPVIPKMTPQTSNPAMIASRLQEAGADAVVMFNRFTGLDIDIEKETPIMHGGFAGHGGPWAIHYLLRWLVATTPTLKIPVSASGGIWTGSDVLKVALAGATTAQMCTAIVVGGYGAITSALGELADLLGERGYDRLSELRGKACGKVLDTDEVDRCRRFAAEIDPGSCTSCGLCREICIYDAIAGEEGNFVVKKSCQGCGLCVELCPDEAISLVPLGCLESDV
jgi:dihydroorotate dehydrogenase (fumarate)